MQTRFPIAGRRRPGTEARLQLLAAFLAVVLWAAWFLPPLEQAVAPNSTGERVALWCAHVLPLGVLLLVPLLGRPATFLAAFPAALVVPFAVSALNDWPLSRARSTGDLVIGLTAFALYALAVPIALRRARQRALDGRRAADAPPKRLATGALGHVRVAFVVALPLVLAYAAHFDRRLHLALADSFGPALGYAQALVALAALAFGAVAADLAFFAPLRATRKRRDPSEIAAEVADRFAVHTRPAGAIALISIFAMGATVLLLVLYLAASD